MNSKDMLYIVISRLQQLESDFASTESKLPNELTVLFNQLRGLDPHDVEAAVNVTVNGLYEAYKNESDRIVNKYMFEQ